MRSSVLLLSIFFLLGSCSLFLNDNAEITVSHNGIPVQYSIDFPHQSELALNIEAFDPDSVIGSVFIKAGGSMIDITSLDTASGPEFFQSSYTILSPAPGEILNVQILVNDDTGTSTIKEFNLDCMSSLPADPDNPVDMVIPEIAVNGGGAKANPAPEGEVFYYNDNRSAAESDIRLDEPIFETMSAKRYLKVMGTAVPDDSGYTDRGYHSVLFSAAKENGSTYYFSIPVNNDDFFRGYIYFPEAGSYNVIAYRAWNSYLYPKETGRGASVSVREGYSTLKFKVNVAPGDEVPSAYRHLIPTRNVDSGTKYLREYARELTSGSSSNIEKVKRIYEFLTYGDANGLFTYRYYDDIYPGYLDNCWSDIFIASHFLNNREGVCNDFSELFAALTRSLGFKVTKVWGYIPAGSGHQWNKILIDGRWYRLDSTWACGSYNYKKYAEFYSEFDAASFTANHENRYYSGLTEEY